MYGKDAIFLLPLVIASGCAVDDRARPSRPPEARGSIWEIVPMAGRAGFVFASTGLSVLSEAPAAGERLGNRAKPENDRRSAGGPALPLAATHRPANHSPNEALASRRSAEAPPSPGVAPGKPANEPPGQAVAPQPATEPEASATQARQRRLVFTFPWADSTLSNGDRALVAATARTLTGKEHISVDGYTDSSVGLGRTIPNRDLAAARAEAVREAFVAGGFPPHRIDVHSHPLCCYAASNETEEGRRRNRRVEVLIETVTMPEEIEKDG